MVTPGESLSKPSSRLPREGGYQLFGDEVFAELGLIRTSKAMDSPLDAATQMGDTRRS
jgi:hypothetical protein